MPPPMPGMPPPHMPPSSGPRQSGGRQQTPLMGTEVKLFVGGLPYDTTDRDVRALFGPYGTIMDIHVMNPSGHSNQRCAFVTFEHHVSALAATKLSGVHRMKPEDKAIVVRFADSQGKRQRVG